PQVATLQLGASRSEWSLRFPAALRPQGAAPSSKEVRNEAVGGLASTSAGSHSFELMLDDPLVAKAQRHKFVASVTLDFEYITHRVYEWITKRPKDLCVLFCAYAARECGFQA
ncbi:hypothetical protein HaLaN_32061, partial [Haematococcus lacustris]